MGNSNSKQSSKNDKKGTSSSSVRPKNRKSQSSNNVAVTREHERPPLSTRGSHSSISKSAGNIPTIVTEQHSPDKSTQDNRSATLSRTNTGQSSRSVKSRRSLNNLSSNHHHHHNNNDDMPQIKKQMSNIETQNSNVESSPHSTKSSSNHRRSHSQNLFHHNNGNDNHLLPRSNKPSNVNSRRSSFNNTDLPPSMIQVQPKPPILKNSKYTQSAHSFQYYENALTDDDNDNNNTNTSYTVQTSANPDATNKSSRQGSIRHSHSSRPSSIKNGISSSSSSSRQRRKSDNNLSITSSKNPDFVTSQSRSNSFVSSLHSRKSSLGSNTNTAYSTPLNSPGVQQLLQHNKNESQDYFGIQSTPNGIVNGEDTMDSTTMGNSTPHSRHHHHHHRSSSSSSVNNINNDGNNNNNSNNNNGTMDDSQANTPDGDSNSYTAVSKMDQYPGGLDAFNTPIGDTDVISNLGFNGVGGNKKKKIYKPIDIDETIQKLLDAGYAAKRTKNVCLKNSEIAQICQQAREIFLSQPSLLELSPPVKIVGDVHGQYGDLLRLFTKCGFPPQSNYLFLGDYVDRGKQSLETILLLLCYKIKYPENFFILRGNHECANVTRVYGFYDECKRRCNIKTWKVFIDTFNTLPLAAIVAGKIFCVHGGLSPVLNSMDEIRHVSRPTDVPDFGLINDLLWSDPTDSPNEWEDNERGVSYCYNKVAINKFLNKFGFDLVCRAHMVVEDGYEFFNDRSLVTVFSAPNYCGEFDNWGAVMSVSDGLLCSFELLDPLDSAALKQVMKKGRQERKVANQQQLHDQR